MRVLLGIVIGLALAAASPTAAGVGRSLWAAVRPVVAGFGW